MEKNEKEFILRQKNGQYQHVGNTRVTFRDGVNKGEPYWDWSNYTYHAPDNTGYDDGVVTKEDIVQINHFYPFGLNMEGDWNGSQGKNKYQYNGKEWNDDFGLGWNDYGRRFYDPALSRFGTRDRFSDTFPDLSPYQYAGNNPIRNIDFMGDSIIVLNAPSGANGAGHAAVLIGNDNEGWKLYSKNGTHGSSGLSGESDKHPQKGESVGSLYDFAHSEVSSGYTEGYMIASDTKTDQAMSAAATAQIEKPYNVLTASCIDVCTDALNAGGFNGGAVTKEVSVITETSLEPVTTSVKTITPIPNTRYGDIKDTNRGGTIIKLK